MIYRLHLSKKSELLPVQWVRPVMYADNLNVWAVLYGPESLTGKGPSFTQVVLSHPGSSYILTGLYAYDSLIPIS